MTFNDGTKAEIEVSADPDERLYIVYKGSEYQEADWWEITLDSSTSLTVTPNLSTEDEGPSIVAISRLNPARIVSTDPELPAAIDDGESIFVSFNKQIENAFIGKIGIKLQGVDDVIYPTLEDSQWNWTNGGLVVAYTGLLSESSNNVEISAAIDGVNIEQIVTAYDA